MVISEYLYGGSKFHKKFPLDKSTTIEKIKQRIKQQEDKSNDAHVGKITFNLAKDSKLYEEIRDQCK